MVKSVGYVAETKGVAERLVKIGYRPLEEEEVLRILEAAIRTPLRQQEHQRHCQITTGLAQFEYVDDIVWREELRFNPLRRLQTAGSKSAGEAKKGGTSFGDVLSQAASLDEAGNHIADAIVEKLSEMFMLTVAEIDKSQPLGKYGVDSLVAVELRSWLVGRMQTEISIFDILQSASLMILAKKAATKSKFVVKAGFVVAE